MPAPAFAQTTTWTEAGGTDNWSDNNNWSDGRPQPGTAVVFRPDGAPDTQFIDFDQSASVASLQVRDDADTFINSSVFTTIDGRAGTQLSISGALKVSSGSSIAGNGSATLVLNGMNIFANRLETTSTLTTNGPGERFLRLVDTQLLLNEDNSSSSDLRTLSNLVLRIESGSVLANVGSKRVSLPVSSSLEFASGGTLDWDGSISGDVSVESGDARIANNTPISGPVTLSGGATTSLTFGASDGVASRSSNLTGVVAGGGRVVVDPNYTLTLSGTNSFTGGLFLRGGTARVSRGSNLGGLNNFVQFEGGTLSAFSGFTAGIDMFVGGAGGAISTESDNLRIAGTLSGPSAANSGDLTKRGAGILTLEGNNSGFFGDWVVERGTLVSGLNSFSFSNSTAVTVEASATLRLEGFEEFAGVNGSGRIEIAAGAPMRIGYDNSDNTFAGEISGAGNVAKWGSGRQTFTGDNLAHTGEWFLNEGSLAFASGESLGGDLVIGDGTTVFLGPGAGESVYSQSFSDASSGPGSIFFNQSGVVTLTGDSSGFTGTLFITSADGLGAGTLNVDGTIAPSVLGIEGGGTLGGSGDILGTATALSTGTIRPDAEAARLRVNGADFRDESTFGVDIASATEFSTLRVLGDVAINGATLDVDLLDGFTPAHGDSFLVLDVDGVVSGSGFSSFDLPEVPGAEWDTSQLLTDGLISIEVTLPGDYNLDGTVDAADYTVWRDNLGEPAGALPSDVDGGAIGQAQYDTWVSHFGQSLPNSATAVPEPTALLLIASLASGLLSGATRSR
ncbi:MAG: autotransporter-associated beta strand repeat-containing protein [Planctomycetota bacterium]